MSWNEFYNIITDPIKLLQQGGYWTLLLVIFLENGLIIGIFLPGDYLLFAAGMFCNEYLDVNIWLLAISIWSVAVLGTMVGYRTGKFAGKKFLQKDRWFLKERHIILTRAYFIKYGSKTILYGKFLPYVRTLAPIIAGIVEMPYEKLMRYNMIGAAVWVFTFVLGGYFLGENFPWIKEYIHYFILAFVVISTIILISSYFRVRRKNNN